MCLLKNKSCDIKGIKRGYEARTRPDPGHVRVTCRARKRARHDPDTCPTWTDPCPVSGPNLTRSGHTSNTKWVGSVKKTPIRLLFNPSISLSLYLSVSLSLSISDLSLSRGDCGDDDDAQVSFDFDFDFDSRFLGFLIWVSLNLIFFRLDLRSHFDLLRSTISDLL